MPILNTIKRAFTEDAASAAFATIHGILILVLLFSFVGAPRGQYVAFFWALVLIAILFSAFFRFVSQRMKSVPLEGMNPLDSSWGLFFEEASPGTEPNERFDDQSERGDRTEPEESVEERAASDATAEAESRDEGEEQAPSESRIDVEAEQRHFEAEHRVEGDSQTEEAPTAEEQPFLREASEGDDRQEGAGAVEADAPGSDAGGEPRDVEQRALVHIDRESLEAREVATQRRFTFLLPLLPLLLLVFVGAMTFFERPGAIEDAGGPLRGIISGLQGLIAGLILCVGAYFGVVALKRWNPSEPALRVLKGALTAIVFLPFTFIGFGGLLGLIDGVLWVLLGSPSSGA